MQSVDEDSWEGFVFVSAFSPLCCVCAFCGSTDKSSQGPNWLKTLRIIWIGKDGAKGQPKLGAAQVDKGEKAKTDAPPSGGGTY